MIKASKDLVHMLKINMLIFNLKIKLCDQITYLFHFFFFNRGCRRSIDSTLATQMFGLYGYPCGNKMDWFFWFLHIQLINSWSTFKPLDQLLDQPLLLSWSFFDVFQPPTKRRKKEGTPNQIWACRNLDIQALGIGEREGERGGVETPCGLIAPKGQGVTLLYRLLIWVLTKLQIFI